MSQPEEEEPFDYENDDSWYEDAMNALDSPANNHNTIYTEEEIADLSDHDKTIIRYRNDLLKAGYTYFDLQLGDYINEVIFFSATIQYRACEFALAYRKDQHHMVIFQHEQEEGVPPHPVRLATLIHTNHHLGAFQFTAFLHLEEPIGEDQKIYNSLNVNRDIVYDDKPSLEIYKPDKAEINKRYTERIKKYNPHIFEFYNEYIIADIEAPKGIETYLEMIDDLEK